MSEEKYYSSEKNVQIVLALLKANGIKKVIASPGTTNYTLVGSMQNDPFFEIYSSVDERSAAYMACGMAAESGEPVVLSCTGATASRDYYPGLTEAFYRKLPVLAITSHQGRDKIGQLMAQVIDRTNIPHDIARISVELPIVKDSRDEAYVVMEANKAILELFRNGGGPAHINITTTYSRDFSVKELPDVRVMRRYQSWDTLPALPTGTICVYIGSHMRFTKVQEVALERFCSTYDAIVVCDHTSGYYGKYKFLPTLLKLQEKYESPFSQSSPFDLMIHIGEVSAATFAGKVYAKEIWRVNEDGELRDPFKKLTTVFQMSEEAFFTHYGKDGYDRHEAIDKYTAIFDEIYKLIPEIPFGNIWTAQQLSSRIPKGSMLHISVSNTRRCWNMFHLPEGVESSCNVGCCGIDGCTSTVIGASLANPNRHYYLVTGDLAFFYDMNVLGNRHVGCNVRIMLINNGIGAEFKMPSHFCTVFGEDANKYMAACGHFGNKSPLLVRHYAEDLGYEYLTASTKEEFLKVISRFTTTEMTDKPMLFEVFTDSKNEGDALYMMQNILVTEPEESGVKSIVKNIIGQKGVDTIKKTIHLTKNSLHI